MAFLAIRQVRYAGDNYEYSSPILGNGLNILEGPNGTGKSTFARLIYFGLGGKVDSFDRKGSRERHREITTDTNNSVTLTVTINDSDYSLKRVFDTNNIAVLGGDVGEILPLYRKSEGERVFSDWLLETLGIKPVKVEYGSYSGVLNITDLMRLIYHNQKPDPTEIYKPVDGSAMVSDSLQFRKAIFEVLAGQRYQEYYAQLARFRTAERKHAEAKKALDLFKEAIDQLGGDNEDINTKFLGDELDELEDQILRLTEYRAELARTPPKQGIESNIAHTRSELLDAELDIARLRSQEIEILDELARYERLRADLILEATQIRKMMFADEKLGLFNPNTCPYCLNDVKRVEGQCVCGHEVLETDYEKFFYNTDDYMRLAKSRQKNVETVEDAIKYSRESLQQVRDNIHDRKSDRKELQAELSHYIRESDMSVNLAAFEEADKKLRDLRETKHSLLQRLELENRRQELEDKLTEAKRRSDKLRLSVEELRIKAEQDIESMKAEFSAVYFDMMKQTVADCRSASLGSDYMPIINHGDYKEASARVPRRLLFFTTFLKLSRIDERIAFPRFLLIDTPETAGIDKKNLIKALDQLAKVASARGKAFPCQVILTTGVDKFPEDQESKVFQRLSDTEKLLRPTSKPKKSKKKSRPK